MEMQKSQQACKLLSRNAAQVRATFRRGFDSFWVKEAEKGSTPALLSVFAISLSSRTCFRLSPLALGNVRVGEGANHCSWVHHQPLQFLHISEAQANEVRNLSWISSLPRVGGRHPKTSTFFSKCSCLNENEKSLQ